TWPMGRGSFGWRIPSANGLQWLEYLDSSTSVFASTVTWKRRRAMSRIKHGKWPITHYIEEPNLSAGWARAFLAIASHSGREIEPLLVSITDFDNGVAKESKSVRDAL